MRLHSAADLAEMFGDNVDVRKIRDWARRHDWPRIEVGREIRFTDEHVAAILAKHTKRPDATTAGSTWGQTKRSAARNAR